MAWTAPRTWVAGEIVTASIMNSAVRDNLLYIKGVGQVPTIESGLTIDNTDGDERLLLPLLSTAECTTVLNAEGEVAFDETTHQMKEYDGTAVRVVISEADVDDTPANGVTTYPISSNWAYDHLYTLTTAGDIGYATGAGNWSRLGIGLAGQVLKTNVGATAPEWAAGIGYTEVVAVTDTLRNSNDTEKSTAAAAYTKIKEILLNENLGACRIKFDLKGMGATGYAKIYKNGVAIGTERTDVAESYTTFSEDFATFLSGDLIQIYAYHSGALTTYVKNMRFYYTKSITVIDSLTLTTALTTTWAASVTNQDP